MIRFLFALALAAALLPGAALATTWRVGPDQTGPGSYTSPMRLFQAGVLVNGDAVRLDACTYVDDYNPDTSSNNVSITRNIAIVAVPTASPNCHPTDPWSGMFPGGGPSPVMAVITLSSCVQSDTNQCWGIAKGLWNISGTAIVSIDHVAFLGAYNAPSDTNGAGIRMESSGTLTLTNDVFAHSQNGVQQTAGSIVFDSTELWDNGKGGCYDSCTHQTYLGGKSVMVSNSYFHDIAVLAGFFAGSESGNHLKSRALSTTIKTTRIYDNGDPASYLIDVPQGGTISITDSVIQKGPNASNPTLMDTGESGADGAMRASSGMTFARNIIVNDLPTATYAIHNGSSTKLFADGNQVYGLPLSRLVQGPATLGTNTALTTRPVLDVSSPVQPNAN